MRPGKERRKDGRQTVEGEWGGREDSDQEKGPKRMTTVLPEEVA